MPVELLSCCSCCCWDDDVFVFEDLEDFLDDLDFDDLDFEDLFDFEELDLCDRGT